MLKRFIAVLIFLGLSVLLAFQWVFTVSEQPQLISQSGENVTQTVKCVDFDTPQAIDNEGVLNILVWNIYKQNKPSWEVALNHLSQQSQLLLLQEASLTSELKRWLIDGQWISNQVSAFKALGSDAGVISIAHKAPIRACAYTSKEPWLRLPKSALYSEYQLSNGQQLAVINIHAINFTVGTDEYLSQLATLEKALKAHQGPIIFAGDFNSWSAERISAMKVALADIDLKEVRFSPDQRTQFITGLPLDHVFYRGLKLKYSKAPLSDASDHNPLLVSFALLN